ncbi:MAG: hypothetical protein AAFN77_08765 [Planctomycetota bacterium]
MNIESRIVNRRLKRIGPIGTIVGLLTASLVAVIGIAIGLEPWVIAIRGSISFLLFSCLTGFGMSVIQAANHHPDR